MMQTNLLHSILDGESKLFSLLQKEKKVFGVKEKTFFSSSSLYQNKEMRYSIVLDKGGIIPYYLSLGNRITFMIFSKLIIHTTARKQSKLHIVADWALSP